jgi:Na+/proline symporter
MPQLYAFVLAAIVVALLAVALYRTSRVKTKADYLVAGRSLPAIVLVLTLLTSWIGAGSLFAGAENAYKNGFAALWQPAGGWLGLLLIYFIAPRARKFAQFTLPDMLEARYNQTARVLGTLAILFAYVGITSYQFKGGGDVLHLIFPSTVTPEFGTYLIATFVIVTTAMAGMSSVAYMDVAIGSLVTVICIVAAPMLFFKAGGWAGLHSAFPPNTSRRSATTALTRMACGNPQGWVFSGLSNSWCLFCFSCLATRSCIRSSSPRSPKKMRATRLSVGSWGPSSSKPSLWPSLSLAVLSTPPAR